MKIPFYKYQGTGNDFILIDNRSSQYLDRKDTELIRHLCERRFGIGADGLILLQHHPDFDFEMVYFNADGREGSMCGNGGRCTVAFAKMLGIIDDHCRFLAVDGPHEGRITMCDWVELKMSDVSRVEKGDTYYFLNTGSPHYVTFVEDVASVDVIGQGRAVRYSERFREKGTNVNFVQPRSDGITVATYERGVEDETFSCGTGVTACAITWYLKEPSPARQKVPVRVKGGELKVHFKVEEDVFTGVWLCGPAKLVFGGEVETADKQGF